MLHQPELISQPAFRIASNEIPQLEASTAMTKSRTWIARSEMSVDELAFRTLVAFRGHSHVNNVLTHISGGNWRRVEQELRAIFESTAELAGLSSVARNILDLMCAERGVTGRILKPLFRSFVHELLEHELAERTIWRLSALYLGVDRTAREAIEAATDSVRSRAVGSQSMSDHDRNESVIKVADIDPRYRHTIIFQLFEHLDPNHSVQLVVENDPMLLRLQFETRYCERCEWTWLEKGPDVWRLRFRVLQRSQGRGGGSGQRSAAAWLQPARKKNERECARKPPQDVTEKPLC